MKDQKSERQTGCSDLGCSEQISHSDITVLQKMLFNEWIVELNLICKEITFHGTGIVRSGNITTFSLSVMITQDLHHMVLDITGTTALGFT